MTLDKDYKVVFEERLQKLLKQKDDAKDYWKQCYFEKQKEVDDSIRYCEGLEKEVEMLKNKSE